MAKKVKKKAVKKDNCNVTVRGGSCSGGCTYGLGFLGAVIYYISTATSFWMGFLGVLKALVWPAFLIFELLKFVGA